MLTKNIYLLIYFLMGRNMSASRLSRPILIIKIISKRTEMYAGDIYVEINRISDIFSFYLLFHLESLLRVNLRPNSPHYWHAMHNSIGPLHSVSMLPILVKISIWTSYYCIFVFVLSEMKSENIWFSLINAEKRKNLIAKLEVQRTEEEHKHTRKKRTYVK